jgi:hypothetical protein
VKCADDLVLVAKEEAMLQDITDRLTESGECYGMEINVEKTQIMRISRQPSPVHVMILQKLLENVEYLNYFGSLISNNARCTREIKPRIVIAKAAFNKEKIRFTCKLE